MFDEKFKNLTLLMNDIANNINRDPQENVIIETYEGLKDDDFVEYETKIGYRLPKSFKQFFASTNGLHIKKNDEELVIMSIQDIYQQLKYNQKNDVYFKLNLDGYHVKVGYHNKGIIYMNVNKNYYVFEEDKERYLYVSNSYGEKWLGVRDLFSFLTNYTNCYFYAYWQDIDAYEYFDNAYTKDYFIPKKD